MAFEVDFADAQIQHRKIGAGTHTVRFEGFEYMETCPNGKNDMSAKFTFLVAESDNASNPRGALRVVIINGLLDASHTMYRRRKGDVASACMAISGLPDPSAAVEAVLSGKFDSKAPLVVTGDEYETKAKFMFTTYTFNPLTEAE